MPVHESRAIIIFATFFRVATQIHVIKILCLSKSVMFHAHVKGASERSELTPCIHYYTQLLVTMVCCPCVAFDVSR